MITRGYLDRLASGDLPMASVRGTVVAYDAGLGDAHDDDRVTLDVTESSIPGIAPGSQVRVAMPQAVVKDANYLVRDLCNGFSRGDMDPVPAGSEITFEHASLSADGTVVAMSYDVDGIERPGAPAPR